MDAQKTNQIFCIVTLNFALQNYFATHHALFLHFVCNLCVPVRKKEHIFPTTPHTDHAFPSCPWKEKTACLLTFNSETWDFNGARWLMIISRMISEICKQVSLQRGK
jgi:hypothetical protein